ncbi:PAP2 superfamily protein [Burkholderia sp. WP9]|uniref:phosphatase PAP2 family protein n=1 Tax=Burkholderia sp. WP9 TaxID=1500263 RepID=UPI000895EB35|nr:phosphatase PAP2 family protein [Burkholderia sp. WP9]SEF11208.1 PAP2 superfamily protein [Burkholderia sp. WP9]
MDHGQDTFLRDRDMHRNYWLRYITGWAAVLAIILVDIAWFRVESYSINGEHLRDPAKIAGIFIGIAVALGLVANIPRYRKITRRLRYAEISDLLAWLTMLSCFTWAGSLLSYLCVTTNAPLIDNSLVRFDLALGFRWPSVYEWVHSHPAVQRVLAWAYASGWWQLIGTPVVLALTRRREELSEFALLFISATIFALLISTPFPAASAFVHFNVTDPNTASSVSDFALLRSGTLRAFDLRSAQGLVSMPSLHTALAVLFAYSLRHVRIISIIACLLNLAMIASTPTQGGHYLADVFSGLVLAFGVIWLSKSLRQRISSVLFEESLSRRTRASVAETL